MTRNNDMDFETIVECMFGDDETKVDDEYQTDAVKERVTDDEVKAFADEKRNLMMKVKQLQLKRK